MDKIKFNELTNKMYIWQNSIWLLAVKIMPLNDWERWSFRAGKNGKVRVSVGKEDFVNVSVQLQHIKKGIVEYRFLWESFSYFENFNKEFYAVFDPITGCDPQDWWKDRECISVLELACDMLEGTICTSVREHGALEEMHFTKKSI